MSKKGTTMKVKLLIAGVSLVLATGCYTTFIQFEPNQQTTERRYGNPFAKKGMRYDGALFGLVELSDTVDLDRSCKEGVSEIEQGRSFFNAVAAHYTLRFWNPQYVKITCSTAKAEPEPEPEAEPEAEAEP